jgi:unsaturated rhamnogalacturonyl hydrolase
MHPCSWSPVIRLVVGAGACVGTGMGFEPAFYYHRPTSAFAALGYGPVLLAGAQMIRLITTHRLETNDSAVQLYRRDPRK